MHTGAKGQQPTHRQPLSRERITRAALRIIDEEGPDSLSMRRIAALLDVQAMSLYNHVRNKADVLDLVTDSVTAAMALPDRYEGDWEDGIRLVAHAFRKAALAHPRACELVLSRQFDSPAALRPLECCLNILLGAGFDEATAVHALRVLIAYSVGSLLRETYAATAYPPASFAQTAAARFAESGFPTVAKVAPLLANVDHEAEYAFGVDMLIGAMWPYAPAQKS